MVGEFYSSINKFESFFDVNLVVLIVKNGMNKVIKRWWKDVFVFLLLKYDSEMFGW